MPSYSTFLASARSSGFTFQQGAGTSMLQPYVRTICAESCSDLAAQLALYDSPDALFVIEYAGPIRDYETADELAGIIGSTEGVFKLEFSSPQGKIATKYIPVLFRPLSLPSVRIIELEISFQYQHFGDAAAAALAELVRRNSTLRSIDLKSCRVGDAGALALVTALAAHENLERLNLRSNVISEPGARNMLIHLALYPIQRAISINVADNSISVDTQRKLRRVFNGKSYPSFLYDEDDINPPICPCRCERCLQKSVDTQRRSLRTLTGIQQQQQQVITITTSSPVSSISSQQQINTEGLTKETNTPSPPPPQQQQQQQQQSVSTTNTPPILQPLTRQISVSTTASPRVTSVVNQLVSDSISHQPQQAPQQTGRLPQSCLCVCICGAQDATPLLTDSDDESSEEQEKKTALMQPQPGTLIEIAMKTICECEELYPREVIKNASINPIFKQKILELRALKRQKDIPKQKGAKKPSPSPWPFPTGDFLYK